MIGCGILRARGYKVCRLLGKITFFFFLPSYRDMRKSKNNSGEMAVPVFGRDEGRVRVSFTTPAVY